MREFNIGSQDANYKDNVTPCPECSDPSRGQVWPSVQKDIELDLPYRLICSICDIHGPRRESYKEARRAWNELVCEMHTGQAKRVLNDDGTPPDMMMETMLRQLAEACGLDGPELTWPNLLRQVEALRKEAESGHQLRKEVNDRLREIADAIGVEPPTHLNWKEMADTIQLHLPTEDEEELDPARSVPVSTSGSAEVRSYLMVDKVVWVKLCEMFDVGITQHHALWHQVRQLRETIDDAKEMLGVRFDGHLLQNLEKVVAKADRWEAYKEGNDTRTDIIGSDARQEILELIDMAETDRQLGTIPDSAIVHQIRDLRKLAEERDDHELRNDLGKALGMTGGSDVGWEDLEERAEELAQQHSGYISNDGIREKVAELLGFDPAGSVAWAAIAERASSYQLLVERLRDVAEKQGFDSTGNLAWVLKKVASSEVATIDWPDEPDNLGELLKGTIRELGHRSGLSKPGDHSLDEVKRHIIEQMEGAIEQRLQLTAALYPDFDVEEGGTFRSWDTLIGRAEAFREIVYAAGGLRPNEIQFRDPETGDPLSIRDPETGAIVPMTGRVSAEGRQIVRTETSKAHSDSEKGTDPGVIAAARLELARQMSRSMTEHGLHPGNYDWTDPEAIRMAGNNLWTKTHNTLVRRQNLQDWMRQIKDRLGLSQEASWETIEAEIESIEEAYEKRREVLNKIHDVTQTPIIIRHEGDTSDQWIYDPDKDCPYPLEMVSRLHQAFREYVDARQADGYEVSPAQDADIYAYSGERNKTG